MSHYYTSQYFLATGGYYQCRDRFKRSKKRRSCRSTPTFLGVLPYHNEKGGMCWCDTETSGWMFTPQRSIHLSSFECLNQRLTDVTRTLDSKMANPKYSFLWQGIIFAGIVHFSVSCIHQRFTLWFTEATAWTSSAKIPATSHIGDYWWFVAPQLKGQFGVSMGWVWKS